MKKIDNFKLEHFDNGIAFSINISLCVNSKI